MSAKKPYQRPRKETGLQRNDLVREAAMLEGYVEASGITRKALSQETGMSEPVLSRVFSGSQPAGWLQLVKIGQALEDLNTEPPAKRTGSLGDQMSAQPKPYLHPAPICPGCTACKDGFCNPVIKAGLSALEAGLRRVQAQREAERKVHVDQMRERDEVEPGSVPVFAHRS